MGTGAPRRAHIGTDDERVVDPDPMRPDDPDRPLLTAGVTAYNAADTIERAVDSALAQTWQPLEILIVDDGSTDGTREILARLEAKHPNIRVILHDTNQGTAVARNTLIDHAQGEAIAFFDDDDISHPERIQRQWHRLTTCESILGRDLLVLCYAGREEIYPDGTVAFHPGPGSQATMPGPHGDRLLAALLRHRRLPREQRGVGGTSGQLGRLATYRRLGGFDARFRRAQDLELDIRLARAGGHVIGLPEPLVRQALKPAEDRNIAIKREMDLLLLHKHRDAFASDAAFAATVLWTEAKYAMRGGNHSRVVDHLGRAMLVHPIHTTRRIANYALDTRRYRARRRGLDAAFRATHEQ